MKSQAIAYLSLILSLSACTVTDSLDGKTYHYALVNASGSQLSVHKDLNSCNGAALRKGIRTTNNQMSSNRSHQRAAWTGNYSGQVACKKI